MRVAERERLPNRREATTFDVEALGALGKIAMIGNNPAVGHYCTCKFSSLKIALTVSTVGASM
jgi:hypothetical protein